MERHALLNTLDQPRRAGRRAVGDRRRAVAQPASEGVAGALDALKQIDGREPRARHLLGAADRAAHERAARAREAADEAPRRLRRAREHRLARNAPRNLVRREDRHDVERDFDRRSEQRDAAVEGAADAVERRARQRVNHHARQPIEQRDRHAGAVEHLALERLAEQRDRGQRNRVAVRAQLGIDRHVGERNTPVRHVRGLRRGLLVWIHRQQQPPHVRVGEERVIRDKLERDAGDGAVAQNHEVGFAVKLDARDCTLANTSKDCGMSTRMSSSSSVALCVSLARSDRFDLHVVATAHDAKSLRCAYGRPTRATSATRTRWWWW